MLILLAIETVEPRGPVGHVFLDLVQGDDEVHAQDLLAEIALVERRLQDRFVQPLQLRKGELRRQQFEANRLIAHLVFETLEGCRQDALVIERQALRLGYGKPGCVAGVGRGMDAVIAATVVTWVVWCSYLGLRLIAGTASAFRQLGEQGVIIEHIYATSRTEEGIKLCRRLGMTEEEFAEEPGRFRFALDVAASDALLLQEYKQGLEEYRAQLRH